jgi:hypothetical protein
MPDQPHTFYTDPTIGLTVTAHPGPGFRALCAELLHWIERDSQGHVYGTQDLITRARAALAEPVGDLAEKLIAESKPLDPELAAVLTTEARWDLYEVSSTAQPPAAQPTPPPAPAGGLVKRVAEKMGPQSQAAMDAGELPYGAARAAIREVAAWMRENETGYNAADWLEQEAGHA